MTLYRATEAGVCTSAGGLLGPGDPYEPALDKNGHLHPEDQAHVDSGRLTENDPRPVSVQDGENPTIQSVPQAVEPVKTSKPAARGKQEA